MISQFKDWQIHIMVLMTSKGDTCSHNQDVPTQESLSFHHFQMVY